MVDTDKVERDILFISQNPAVVWIRRDIKSLAFSQNIDATISVRSCCVSGDDEADMLDIAP